MNLWEAVGQVAMTKLNGKDTEQLVMLDLCKCCEIPEWCVARVAVARKVVGPRGGATWQDRREGYVTHAELTEVLS